MARETVDQKALWEEVQQSQVVDQPSLWDGHTTGISREMLGVYYQNGALRGLPGLPGIESEGESIDFRSPPSANKQAVEAPSNERSTSKGQGRNYREKSRRSSVLVLQPVTTRDIRTYTSTGHFNGNNGHNR